MHVLVVGSSVVDLFMTLDSEHFEVVDKKVQLELGDKIPSEIKKLALGGNGSNAAVGLTRLEIPTSFFTYLGGDILSQEITNSLSSEGVALLAQKDNGTTSLNIIFDFETDRIIFTHHQKRQHNFTLQDKNFDYVYLHSIGNPWEDAYRQVLDYVKSNNIPLAFSPGSAQIENINDVFEDVLKSSKIFFSNRQEAAKIAKIENPETDIKEIIMAVKNLGPQIVSVTDGSDGAYAMDTDNNTYFIKPSPEKGVEKTGAGDSYASAFFAAMLHGQNLPTAMSWGVHNAESVMKQVGAQAGLLTKSQLDEELKKSDNLMARPL